MSTGQDPFRDGKSHSAENLCAVQNTFLVFCAGTVFLWFCVCAAVRVFGHTERLEWVFYEAASIAVALFLWLSAVMLRRLSLPLAVIRAISVLLLAATSAAAALLWSNGDLPALLAVFLGLALIPAGAAIWQGTRPEALGPPLETALLILLNVVGLLAVVSFFNVEALAFESYFGSVWTGGFLWGLGLIAAFTIVRRLRRQTADCTAADTPMFPGWSMAGRVAILAGVLLILSFVNLRGYDYQHSRNYVGAIHDVWHGRSLLYDTPSFYGYLNMHLLSFFLGPVGISFEMFTFTDGVLLALWQVAGGCVLFRVWPWRRTRFFAALLFVFLHPLFGTDSTASPYSTGPLRFGIGLAVCWALICLPSRAGRWTGAFLSAVAVFWSGETAVFVAPAWLFYCVADAMRSRTSLQERSRTALGWVAVYIALCGAVCGCIFWREYRPGLGFPLLESLFQYAGEMSAGKSTSGLITASMMTAFGNYYFLVVVFVLGLAAMAVLFVNHSPSRWFGPLAFMSIHNVAVFAHFVGHSEHEYVFDLAGFAFIEFALVCRILQEDYGMSRAKLWPCFGVPVVVFCTLLLLRPAIFLPLPITVAMQYPRAARQLIRSFHNSEKNPALLPQIMQKYAGGPCPVAIISNRDDTKLLVEANMMNALCLNPLYNLAILPDGIDRFVRPSVARMESGTILLVDRIYLETTGHQSDISDGVVRAESTAAEAILDRLKERFTLKELGVERDGRPGYQESDTDPPYVDLIVFRLDVRS